MKKYFIFSISKDFFQVYKDNINALYKTLENLYTLSAFDFGYGISIYNQLCMPFNTSIINDYYREYRLFDNKYVLPEDLTILEINKSCLVVLSKYNLPEKLKRLYYYSNSLFVCSFNTNEFFWLKKNPNVF